MDGLLVLKRRFKQSFLLLYIFLLITLISIISYESQNIIDIADDSRVFHQECQCYRKIIKSNTDETNSSNTCSEFSQLRGQHQNVIAFTFYEGQKEFRTTFDDYKRDYFVGIERNLSLMKKFYGTNWIMRLYYHLSKNSTNWQRLCTLVCQDSNIDICDVENNPKFGNISNVFPLNWRFLPSIDDQVDLLLVRDLDSDLSKREYAAVSEFIQSDMDFHIMRDHPQHDIQILGGTWGIKLVKPEIRQKMSLSIRKMFGKDEFYASREHSGPDQKILKHIVWPWARSIAMSHDAYKCRRFSGTQPFPSRRNHGIGNFVGSVISLNNSIPFTNEYQCPEACRPKNHTDWLYC